MDTSIVEIIKAIAPATITVILGGGFTYYWNSKLTKFKIDQDKVTDLFRAEIAKAQHKKNRIFDLYSNGQHEIYTKVWDSIVDLENAVDELWERVDGVQLGTFNKAVYDAKINIKKASPFVDTADFLLIESFFLQLEEYKTGKQRLLFLTNRDDDIVNADLERINQHIDNNSDLRDAIHNFSNSFSKNIRNKLKGNEDLKT